MGKQGGRHIGCSVGEEDIQAKLEETMRNIKLVFEAIAKWICDLDFEGRTGG